jgi:hypothetical protein
MHFFSRGILEQYTIHYSVFNEFWMDLNCVVSFCLISTTFSSLAKKKSFQRVSETSGDYAVKSYLATLLNSSSNTLFHSMSASGFYLDKARIKSQGKQTILI